MNNMENWKEKFDETFKDRNDPERGIYFSGYSKDDFKVFIQVEIIERLIDDAHNTYAYYNPNNDCNDVDIKERKQQLKAKWLTKNENSL